MVWIKLDERRKRKKNFRNNFLRELIQGKEKNKFKLRMGREQPGFSNQDDTDVSMLMSIEFVWVNESSNKW